MTQEKSDLRVRRTQKMLQEALIDLIGERSLDTISVGDIAERAMVNRATFYRHLASPTEGAGVDVHREESHRAERRSAKRSRPGRPRARGAK